MVKRFAFAGGALFAAALVVAACSNQGEGEVCDTHVGNDDCQNGLVCGPSPNAIIADSPNPFRCCPPVGTPSTVYGCVQGSVTISTSSDASIGDGAAATDGATSVDGAIDAGTSVDASSSDAGASATGTDANGGVDASDASSALDAADGASG